MILCPVSIEICFAVEFQGNKLKRSTGLPSLLVSMLGVKTSTGPPLTFLFQGERLKTSTGGYSCSRLSGQEAKKVPRTFLLPKVIKYGDG